MGTGAVIEGRKGASKLCIRVAHVPIATCERNPKVVSGESRTVEIYDCARPAHSGVESLDRVAEADEFTKAHRSRYAAFLNAAVFFLVP